MKEENAFNTFPITGYLLKEREAYHYLRIGEKEDVSVYFSLDEPEEKITILSYVGTDSLSIQGEKCVIIAHLNIEKDVKKLKMFLTLIDKIAENSGDLRNNPTYATFFI